MRAQAAELRRVGKTAAAAELVEEAKVSTDVLADLQELAKDYERTGEAQEAMKILNIREHQLTSLSLQVAIDEIAQKLGSGFFRKNIGREKNSFLLDLLKVKRQYDVEALTFLKGEFERARAEAATATGERQKLEKKKMELLERALRDLNIEARIDALEGKIARAEAGETVFAEKKEKAIQERAEETEERAVEEEEKFEGGL